MLEWLTSDAETANYLKGTVIVLFASLAIFATLRKEGT